jgi:hypothetical protein
MNSRTTDITFSQSASAEEKAAILQNEKRLNTRAAMQAVLDPTLAGRFAKEAKADFTVGNSPTVEYPKLPDGSPWRQQQPPPEEPFGIDIQYVEPCGTPAEIERAAAILSATECSAEASPASSSSQQGQSEADLPPLLRSADPAPTIAASSAPGVVGADPTLGSTGPSSVTLADQQLAAPSVDAEPRVEHRRGGAALSSKPSFRRIG